MQILLLLNPGLLRTTLCEQLEEWGHVPVLASDAYEAQEMLNSEHAPRLAILEAYLPGMSGLQICERVRAEHKHYTYVMVVSSGDQHSSMVQALESGADDFIRQPLDCGELRLRLQVAERILQSQQLLLESREAFRFEASHDPLLRLWNRKGILNLLAIELSRAKRLQIPLSILLADLDYFKHVNDRYGHLVGDDALRNAAIRMSGEIREYDHLGRFGGEEFLAVLPNCPSAVARHVAERVRCSVAERPLLAEPWLVHATLSIGVTEWRPGQEIPDLLEQADIALYRAKANGRNRVEFVEAPPCALGEAERSLRNFRRRDGSEYTPPETAVSEVLPQAPDRQVQFITLCPQEKSLADQSQSGAQQKGEMPRCLKVGDAVKFHFYMTGGRECSMSATVHDNNGVGIGFQLSNRLQKATADDSSEAASRSHILFKEASGQK